MLHAGEKIGRYRIRSPLGAGGMGEVYLAKDLRLNRKIAIKVLPGNIAADKEHLRQFEREARAASALNHPNILTVYEFGRENGVIFLATEFVEGETLRQKLERGELKIEEILNIAQQVVFALIAAHQAGIVHRDIKPENIMIRSDSLVKVLDFGVAKLTKRSNDSVPGDVSTAPNFQTEPGTVKGTVAYMSPEQACGQTVDGRTDVWSLGVVLYEMIAGRLPFVGETYILTIVAILENEPERLSKFSSQVTPELERIVGKALAKEPERRYRSAHDLMIDLKNLRSNLKPNVKLERAASFEGEIEAIGKTVSGNSALPAKKTVSAKEFVTRKADPGTNRPSSRFIRLAGKIKNNPAVVLGMLGVFVLALGVWSYLAYLMPPDEPIKSVAVLPFQNVTGDTNLDYMSEGLSEKIIDRLSLLPELKVVARTSSFEFKGKENEPQTIARSLRVETIVIGKIALQGNNLIVRAELVDARENRQLWGDEYNRKASEALAVQEEIAQMISEKLRPRLSKVQEQKPVRRETGNPQAYEVLLKGRYFWRKGDSESQKKAVEFFERAVEIDPNYAFGYSDLSSGYMYLAGNSHRNPKVYIPKAEKAAQTALQLDEELADAHYALANVKRDTWEWVAAEREYLRAIELNPNLARAHSGYAYYLSLVGRHEHAIAEARLAKELDPFSHLASAVIGNMLYHARRYDEAINELNKILELDQNFSPAYVYLNYVYSAKGMYREAIEASQKAITSGGSDPSKQIFLGAAYAKVGEREKAQAILKQLQANKDYVSPGELAILYAALGYEDEAFTSLEKAYAERDLQLQYLKVDPAFDSLRHNPRFRELLRKVGFPQ